MPSLGTDMEYGTVVAWHATPGAALKHGDVIADIQTEKGVFEVECPMDGVIERIVVERGTRVRVGTVLALLRAPGPSAPPEALPAAVRASPAARRMAQDRGISLSHVQGTGPNGVVTLADVLREIAGAEAAAAPAPATGAAAMRQAVAATVSKSKREIPHYYLATDIDLGAALTWLQAENTKRPVTERILPAAMLVRAVAVALRRFPDLNGIWKDGGFQRSDAIHVGVAISLRTGGLLAPAIHDADRTPLRELMVALQDLVQRARNGGLRGSEMTDATITITNLGDAGAHTVFGVIFPPQVALVGFGQVTERAWADHGGLVVRPVVTATLSGDHRVTDGHYGALFLGEIARLLASPEAL
jgi:pyruvate dehydrogenase E2 component (dihydrolipoamide acetyltransferase)